MNDLVRTDVIEAPARFSIDEFMQIVDAGVFEGWRVELVEGEIIRMSPALAPHKLLQRRLFVELNAIFEARDDLDAFFELTVVCGDRTLRDIDVAVSRPLTKQDRFLVPADVLLAIEVSASTLAYDLRDKRRDYAQGGIPTYWVVDVDKSCVHVLERPIDVDYTAQRLVPFGEPLAVPGSDRTITLD